MVKLLQALDTLVRLRLATLLKKQLGLVHPTVNARLIRVKVDSVAQQKVIPQAVLRVGVQTTESAELVVLATICLLINVTNAAVVRRLRQARRRLQPVKPLLKQLDRAHLTVNARLVRVKVGTAAQQKAIQKVVLRVTVQRTEIAKVVLLRTIFLLISAYNA